MQTDRSYTAENMQGKKLNIGVLGCGPIAQFAHFEACQKGRNVALFAICDKAEDLVQQMEMMWKPVKTYLDYATMLEDPEIDAIIIATADALHVPLALQAIHAGKHVLIEKPLSHSLEECIELEECAERNEVVVQVGHMKRFDEGIAYAKKFVDKTLGEIVALKAWYGDNTHRYTMTDNVQPIPFKSTMAVKPISDPKADPERYYMMAHGSHLLDTAQFLAGSIGSVQAHLRTIQDIWCWFIDVEFASGAVGHLDLTIKIRGDWHEGFQVYGTGGSVFAKTYNPWFYKSSEVQCYSEDEKVSYSPLAADGFSYRLQLEAFADVIMSGDPMLGTSIREGTEITRGMIAIHQSIQDGKRVYLDQLKATAI